MRSLEDHELTGNLARHRDERAFAELYDRHAPLVFSLAYRFLGRRTEAEDLLQAVFLYVWENAAAYDPSRGSVGAWLHVVARSRCLDRLRRRALREGRDRVENHENGEADLLEALPAPGPAPLEELAAAERRSEMTRALEALPSAQRAVLEAAYFEGLTQQEIAEKLDEPLGTVKTRMRLGLRKLADQIMVGERGV